MAEEQKTLEIQRLLLEAKNSSELGINQKYVESIQSQIISYLLEVKTKGIKPEKLKITQAFAVVKVEGEGYEQFIRSLNYVRSITFPETFSYDMKYKVVRITSPSQKMSFLDATQTVHFEIEFIERPGINSPSASSEEGAIPQSETNS